MLHSGARAAQLDRHVRSGPMGNSDQAAPVSLAASAAQEPRGREPSGLELRSAIVCRDSQPDDHKCPL
jgi:hypothetical protein